MMKGKITEEKEIIRVNNLNVIFEGKKKFQALQNISFQINSGKTLALVGQSGSGKSVTSLAIMNLLPSTAKITGTIDLFSEIRLDQITNHQFRNIRGKEIGMIFQEPMSALNPLLTCGEQLSESILCHQRISTGKARIIALEWFKKVKLPNPTELYNRYPHQLSGGQKQRIMIAMAICNHPKLLIADEPTTALDVTVQKEIIELIQHLQMEFGMAILFITHDLALAKFIADDFLILEKGKIVHTPMDFTMPSYTDLLEHEHSKAILEVEHLKIYFPKKNDFLGKQKSYFKAVDDVSFKIFRGETLGLVGESGCGKSTLSKALLGLQQITDGSIKFKQAFIHNFKEKSWKIIRKSVQIIFQDPYSSLNPRIKIGDAIKEPILAHRLMNNSDAHQKMEALLEEVGLLKIDQFKYPHEFSGGQRQRISIARALAVDPELIICDESVSALDINIQKQILELLSRLQQEKKLTYLFITHDLNVVKNISNRILVMQKGKIIEQGLTSEIMSNPQNPYTQKLLSAVLTI